MAKRDKKTRIVRSGGGEKQSAPEMNVSYIDLNTFKHRYGGSTLTPEELEEIEREKHGKVRDGGRELSIFGEEEQEEEVRDGRKYTLLAIGFFLVLFISLAVALYTLLIIDRIEVTGNERLEKGEVLTIAGINIGEHMWLADVGGAVQALEADAAIKSATVKRVYPDALAISIEERVPIAYIEGSGAGAVIDIEGYVMEITPTVPDGLIAIYGFSSAGFQMSQRLGQYSAFNSSTLLEVLTVLSQQGVLESIDNIDMSQPLRIGMTTSDGYSINVGQPDNIGEKLSDLGLVLSKVRSMGYVGGTIDVGVLGGPVYTPPMAVQPEEELQGEEAGEEDAVGGEDQEETEQEEQEEGQ